LVREVIRQKDSFLNKIEEEEASISKEQVSKLIEEFQLYEYSVDAVKILLGHK